MEMWGRTVCDLPKYKSKKWTYVDMIKEATTDEEIKEYLDWVLRHPNKSAKTRDLANYLTAVEWKFEAVKCYYDGSSDVRHIR